MPERTKDRFLTSLHVSLKDKNNGTYRGNLILKNWTVIQGNHNDVPHVVESVGTTLKPGELVDPVGASYYVIAVVLVYGMSIVALIASHIKRKHGKVIEDRQINKYLREFQTVKDTESRESYKNLKKKIKEQINWEKPQNKAQSTLQQNLSHALLPMIAFGVSVPQLHPANSVTSMYWQRSRSNSLFNSQNSVYTPRSRASSVGSHNSTASMPSLVTLHHQERSPNVQKHERKRGMANLLSGIHNHNDFPLEKILEESMSRENSVVRKGSKRRHHSHGATPSSPDQPSIGAGLPFPLDSDFESKRAVSLENIEPLPDMTGSTSELGSSMEAMDTPSPHPYGSSLGDSGMGRSTSPGAEMELGESAVTHMEKIQQMNHKNKKHSPPSLQLTPLNASLVTKHQPSVHKSSILLKPPPPNSRKISFINVPQIPPSLQEEDHGWSLPPNATHNQYPSQSQEDRNPFWSNGEGKRGSPPQNSDPNEDCDSSGNNGLSNEAFVQSPLNTTAGFSPLNQTSLVVSVHRDSSPFSSSSRYDANIKDQGDMLELISKSKDSDDYPHNAFHKTNSPVILVSNERKGEGQGYGKSSRHQHYYLSSDESDSESELLQITCV